MYQESFHEYFFHVHSGTKLATRITMNASQNRFQSNEITDSTLRAPMMARAGRRIPSILQWTLPQDRPFIKQPSPAHATAVTQRAPVAYPSQISTLSRMRQPNGAQLSETFRISCIFLHCSTCGSFPFFSRCRQAGDSPSPLSLTFLKFLGKVSNILF
jgi:hypothetical protein